MAINVAQSKTANASSTNVTVTMTNPTVTGNLFIIDDIYVLLNADPTFTSNTDTNGDSWASVAVAAITCGLGAGGTNHATGQERYNAAISAGQAAHQFTLNTTNASICRIVATEVNGQAVSPLDVSQGNIRASGGTTVTTDNVTTTQAAEYWHGCGWDQQQVNFNTFSLGNFNATVQTNEQNVANSSGVWGVITGGTIAAATATTNYSYTTSHNTDISGVMISTWKQAAGGATRPVKMAGEWGGFAGESGGFAG